MRFYTGILSAQLASQPNSLPTPKGRRTESKAQARDDSAYKVFMHAVETERKHLTAKSWSLQNWRFWDSGVTAPRSRTGTRITHSKSYRIDHHAYRSKMIEKRTGWLEAILRLWSPDWCEWASLIGPSHPPFNPQVIGVSRQLRSHIESIYCPWLWFK
jgi:hypothetical protein